MEFTSWTGRCRDFIRKENTLRQHSFLESKDTYKTIAIPSSAILFKEKNIVSQKMETSCEIGIVTQKKNAETIYDIFNSMFGIEVKPVLL